MGTEDPNTSLAYNVLEQNCRDDWPIWTCIFANISGMCSTTLWFIVLLPQVWKNFRRKSVKGLSVLWATANFTASLINLFFVFIYVTIPLYGQISSIYCPILEFALLIQFWIYGRYRKIEKLVYGSVCVLLWGVVIVVELVFKIENFIEYIAILLWCIETFPQVLLNMRLQSTSGQATCSVCIAMIGKTTDFFATNILVMPFQYVIMCYFSSSVAYVNGFQVAWYYGQDDVIQPNDEPQSLNTKQLDRNQSDKSSLSVTAYNDQLEYGLNSTSTSNLTPTAQPNKSSCILICRVFCMVLITCLLLMCIIGFVLNVHSFYGLFAPTSIGLILGTAYTYFTKCKRSSYHIPNI